MQYRSNVIEDVKQKISQEDLVKENKEIKKQYFHLENKVQELEQEIAFKTHKLQENEERRKNVITAGLHEKEDKT